LSMTSLKVLPKEKIRAAFSRAASTYDSASGVQTQSAERLIRRMIADGCAAGNSLDVGMGTGAATRRLARRIGGRVYGCDMAWGMVSFAKRNGGGLLISQADMEKLPYRDNIFDIVFSNIAYQWSADLRGALAEVQRVLKPAGRFYFSILARGSLRELASALKAAVQGDPRYDLLPARETIVSALAGAGLTIRWDEEFVITRYYDSPLELIKTFKKMGAAKISEDVVFGMGKRRLFFDMVEAYKKNFTRGRKVFATYNVVMGCAQG